MRVSPHALLVALIGSFASACASGEAASQTPQSTTTVDLAPETPDAELSAEEAARELAKNAGGVLSAKQEGVADVFGGRGVSDGRLEDASLSGLSGSEAEAYGADGLVATGRGAGGTGEGSSGGARLGGSHRVKVKVTAGSSEVTGALAKDVVESVVRQSHGRLGFCYKTRLMLDPQLAGELTTKFTISPDGKVSSAKSEGTLNDSAVIDCVEKTFRSMIFPKPDKGGTVVVSYPVVFAPGDSKN